MELLQTLYTTSLDINFRKLVLQVRNYASKRTRRSDDQAMERITRIPPAVLSLVHRNHFIIWLDSQWMLSESGSNRGVEEERDLYMTILENIVTVLAGRQREKAEKASEENLAKGREWETKGREWILSIERLMAKGLVEAGKFGARSQVKSNRGIDDRHRALASARPNHAAAGCNPLHPSRCASHS